MRCGLVGLSSLVPTLRVGTQLTDAPRQDLDAERRRKLRSHAERGNEKRLTKIPIRSFCFVIRHWAFVILVRSYPISTVEWFDHADRRRVDPRRGIIDPANQVRYNARFVRPVRADGRLGDRNARPDKLPTIDESGSVALPIAGPFP